MILSAQRVASPLGATGINAFKFTHGAAFPLPENLALTPAYLVQRRIEVPGAGLNLRSSLDIAVPDGTPFVHVIMAMVVLPGDPSPGRFGTFQAVGNCYCRFAMDAGMATVWSWEIGQLSDRIKALWWTG
jgi:hypothetical protein